MADTHVPDEAYDRRRAEFSDQPRSAPWSA